MMKRKSSFFKLVSRLLLPFAVFSFPYFSHAQVHEPLRNVDTCVPLVLERALSLEVQVTGDEARSMCQQAGYTFGIRVLRLANTGWISAGANAPEVQERIGLCSMATQSLGRELGLPFPETLTTLVCSWFSRSFDNRQGMEQDLATARARVEPAQQEEGQNLSQEATPSSGQQQANQAPEEQVRQQAQPDPQQQGEHTAVEYAVMLAMILVVCLAAIASLDQNQNRCIVDDPGMAADNACHEVVVVNAPVPNPEEAQPSPPPAQQPEVPVDNVVVDSNEIYCLESAQTYAEQHPNLGLLPGVQATAVSLCLLNRDAWEEGRFSEGMVISHYQCLETIPPESDADETQHQIAECQRQMGFAVAEPPLYDDPIVGVVEAPQGDPRGDEAIDGVFPSQEEVKIGAQRFIDDTLAKLRPGYEALQRINGFEFTLGQRKSDRDKAKNAKELNECQASANNKATKLLLPVALKTCKDAAQKSSKKIDNAKQLFVRKSLKTNTATVSRLLSKPCRDLGVEVRSILRANHVENPNHVFSQLNFGMCRPWVGRAF